MKIGPCIALITVAAALTAVAPWISASTRDVADVPTQMVITVLPSHGEGPPEPLAPTDLTVVLGKIPAPVTGLERLTGDLARMQLFILLDDSTASSALSIHFPELRAFIESLPPTTEVAIGYMRNGTSPVAQPFTTDHQKAADALRLPLAVPGLNGSPYFSLSDLMKHWPSQEPTGRRAVLMLTDGVDRYYNTAIVDDPYVDAAIADAQKKSVMVYSIYLRDAGAYDRSGWVTNFAQSRLDQVTRETGGYSYFQDLSNPVDIAPYFKDLQDRLDNQYQVTLAAVGDKGLQPVKLRSARPGLKIAGPAHIYVQ
jgi:hypothetical protein